MTFGTSRTPRLTAVCLILAAVVISASPARAGFPLHRGKPNWRIAGPVVPAPKNWGYRPTRWVRWESHVVHPALGPIPPDVEEHKAASTADPDAETIETPAPVEKDTAAAQEDTLPEIPELPDLPLDDMPPPMPDDFDQDLPPLPGEVTRPGKPAKSTKQGQDQAPGKTAPGKTAPGQTAPGKTAPGQTAPGKTPRAGSGKPQFRDPDAIFDKQPSTGPTPKPEAAKPAEKSAPATPAEKTKSPTGEPQWEKRTRDKPATEKAHKRSQPKKKEGQPFYDPDSIFEQSPKKSEPSPKQSQSQGGWRKAEFKTNSRLSSATYDSATYDSATYDSATYDSATYDSATYDGLPIKRQPIKPRPVPVRDHAVRPATFSSDIFDDRTARPTSEPQPPAQKIDAGWQAGGPRANPMRQTSAETSSRPVGSASGQIAPNPLRSSQQAGERRPQLTRPAAQQSQTARQQNPLRK